MIFGIGTDISKVSRFEKWVNNPGIFQRFFNEAEIKDSGTIASRCEHYAARFAAKEAFSKALGTGICGFELKDVFITKETSGRPVLNVCGTARDALEKKISEMSGLENPDYSLFVSLSHEKEYAIAFVVIEYMEKRLYANR